MSETPNTPNTDTPAPSKVAVFDAYLPGVADGGETHAVILVDGDSAIVVARCTGAQSARDGAKMVAGTLRSTGRTVDESGISAKIERAAKA